ERDVDLGRRIGDQCEIPYGSKWVVVDRTERGHHDVGAGISHALAQPRLQVVRWERLASQVAREIGGSNENQIFSFHGGKAPSSVIRRSMAGPSKSGPLLPEKINRRTRHIAVCDFAPGAETVQIAPPWSGTCGCG